MKLMIGSITKDEGATKFLVDTKSVDKYWSLHFITTEYVRDNTEAISRNHKCIIRARTSTEAMSKFQKWISKSSSSISYRDVIIQEIPCNDEGVLYQDLFLDFKLSNPEDTKEVADNDEY